MRVSILAIVCLFRLSAFTQVSNSASPSPPEGIVLDDKGSPVAQVVVYGSLGKCCPVQREFVKTDSSGRFSLSKSTTIVGFVSERFEPKTILAPTNSNELTVRLDPIAQDLRGRTCSSVPGMKQMGWMTLRFMVPKRGVKITGGKWDADYVEYGVQPIHGTSWLELWFGPTSLSTDPDDEIFLKSDTWSQRNIVEPNGQNTGMDSRGKLKTGGLWRQTAVPGIGGARYGDASAEDAPVFDKIIDSICFLPLSRK